MLGVTNTEDGFEWTSKRARNIWIGVVAALVVLALFPTPERTYESITDAEAQALTFGIGDRLDDDVTFEKYINSSAAQRAATARWERWLHTGNMVVPDDTEAVPLDPKTRRLMDCLDTSENHVDERYHQRLLTDRAAKCLSSGRGAIVASTTPPQ